MILHTERSDGGNTMGIQFKLMEIPITAQTLEQSPITTTQELAINSSEVIHK